MNIQSLMKKRLILLPLLSMTLFTAACSKTNANAATAVESVTTVDASTEETATEAESSVEETTATAEPSAEENATAADASTAESIVEASDSAEATDETAASDTSVSESSDSTLPEGFTERDFDTSYTDYTTITLSGSKIEVSGSGVATDGTTVTITEEGTYRISGELTDGQIRVDLPGETDKAQLVLDGVTITNQNTAGIYVLNADKVFVTTAAGSSNEISVTGSFVQTDENNVDGAIFSKADLVLNGEGTLTINDTEEHGIVSKDDLKITSGTYVLTTGGKGLQANDLLGIAGGNITIQAGSDGLRSDLQVSIYDGTLNIVGTEGIESTIVEINGGDTTIYATDDGINASLKGTEGEPTITINGGTLSVSMAQGDTDAIDSNGYLYINGGTVNIEAQFAFDFVYGAELNGGTVYVNGNEVTAITNSMMGGFGGGWGGGQMPGGDMSGGTVSG